MNLREIRISHNLKVQEVADYLCCLPSVYSRYESGKREPSIDILLKLSKLYRVSVDYLIGNSENKKSPSEKEELTADEQKLLDYFRSLNEEGQYILISQAEALTLSGQYIKTNSAKLGEA